MTEDAEAALIAEQLRHTIDLLRGELHALQAEQQHARDLAEHRLAQLEVTSRDHETRLRTLTEGVTQFKVWSGLWSGSSGILSFIALVKAWFGAG